MNGVLAEINRTRIVGIGEKVHPVVFDPSVGEFLTSIITAHRPKVSLEVGLAYGVSSLYICEALSKVGATKHYLMDPNQSSEWSNIGLTNLRNAGFADLIDFREEMSHLALPQILKEGASIDFAFIDGWHVFDQVLVDFFFIDKMLKVGGVIAFDDTAWPGVRKVLRFILKNRNYEVLDCLTSPYSKRDALARAIQPLTRLLGFAKPELSDPDGSLRLRAGSRCIALRKTGEDTRGTTDFCPF